jgi:hypothetical protein
MNLSPRFGMLASVVAIALSSSSARAQSCEATTDCPKNYLCSVFAYADCGSVGPSAGAATSTGAMATAGSVGVGFAAAGGAAQTMPVAVGGSPGVNCGTSVAIKHCVALPCTSDIDCAVGWACKSDVTTTCATNPAPEPATAGGASGTRVVATAGIGNTAAATAGPASDVAIAVGGATSTGCTTSTQSTCQPKAQDACTTADDCGPGYDCVDQTTCGCSSSGSVGAGSTTLVDPAPTAAGGSAAMPRTAVAGGIAGFTISTGGAASVGTMVVGGSTSIGTAPDCTCTSSGVKGCRAQTIACVSTADCPETWTCVGTVDATGTLNGTCEPPYPYFNGGSVNYGNGPGATGSGTTASVDNVSGTGGVATVRGTGSDSNAAAPTEAGGGCQMGRGDTSRFAMLLFGALVMFGVQRRRRH